MERRLGPGEYGVKPNELGFEGRRPENLSHWRPCGHSRGREASKVTPRPVLEGSGYGPACNNVEMSTLLCSLATEEILAILAQALRCRHADFVAKSRSVCHLGER